jgi:Pyridoxal-phosphate dependent enzyme
MLLEPQFSRQASDWETAAGPLVFFTYSGHRSDPVTAISAVQLGDVTMLASALDLIGRTPLVALDRVHSGPGRIVAKAEFLQPGGSVKDRAAKAIVLAERQHGCGPRRGVRRARAPFHCNYVSRK